MLPPTKTVLDLGKSVDVSGDGFVHTIKLRDDVFFHHGRKMDADDVIYTFNRLMDGKKAYPGARWVRLIKGAVDVEKGQAQTISGLRKIDDFTIEMTLTERSDPGFAFMNITTAIYPRDEADKESFASKPIGLGPFRFVEYVPGSRLSPRNSTGSTCRASPTPTGSRSRSWGEAAARDVAFRNREIDVSILGPAQYVAYQADPNSRRGFSRSPRCSPQHGHEPHLQAVLRQAGRQAINHAIDSDLIIKRLVRDKAYRAVGGCRRPRRPSTRT